MEHYRRQGLTFDVTESGPSAGEVVVLLHGFPETRYAWTELAPILARAGYRVLCPDQRGYSPGARPTGRRAYVVPELVDDVLALADAAGAPEVHVVGHDWGGAVAWQLAADHPDRVRTVSVLSTPHPRAMARALAASTQALRSWYMVFFQLPALPEAALAPHRRRFVEGLVRGGLPREFAERYAAVLAEPGALTAAVNWYRGLPLAGRPLTGPVDVPALYVWSTGDHFLTRRAAELTAHYVRGPYRFAELPGVSHWIPETAAAAAAALILERLAGPGA